MTAVRLSPAASLLRSSKLFALPPAVALPPPEPSSEPVPRSDTATSIYPTRAAIETPLTSLGRGDWGFKRPLPLKSTTKSNSPTVRLNKGIDTAEHIADFDSAADHVLTLKKFQELNQAIQHPRSPGNRHSKVHHGVFRRHKDNTTNTSAAAPGLRQYTGVWPSLSPSELRQQLPSTLNIQNEDITKDDKGDSPTAASRPAKLERWRYEGPSLVQLSGLEFDRWIKTLNSAKRQEFRHFVKQVVLGKKRTAQAVKAQDEGTVGEIDPASLQVSEEETSDYLRKLRQAPREFGALIAEFLDLPQGHPGTNITVDLAKAWDYGRHSLSAADPYEESGPPKMHPSAGLSYIHSDRWAQNHAAFGPQDRRLPVVARQVKIRARGTQNAASTGVAGFIVDLEAYKGTRNQNTPAYTPQQGGQKTVVKLGSAEIDQNGALKLTALPEAEYLVDGTKAVHNSMISNAGAAALRPSKESGSRVMQPLTRTRAVAPTYKKREDLTAGAGEEDLDFLGKAR